ncbi:hypothetical protein ACS0TY_010227 [Phlomoides rotata]
MKILNSVGNGQVDDELYRFTQVVLGYALETAAYILNLVLSKSVPKTPSELWTGRKPNSETHKNLEVSNLRVG